MPNPWGGRWMLAGVAGAVVGGLVEGLVNSVAGRPMIADGILWGAVLAIVLVSLPSFGQMGRLAVKNERPAVHFLVGLVLFVVISVVVVTLFFGLFLLVGRLLS